MNGCASRTRVIRLQRHHCSHIQTPKSRPQVIMTSRGELVMHADVVFEANAATHGGAVSLPFDVVPGLTVWYGWCVFSRCLLIA